MQLSAYIIVLASMKSECVKSPSSGKDKGTQNSDLLHSCLRKKKAYVVVQQDRDKLDNFDGDGN